MSPTINPFIKTVSSPPPDGLTLNGEKFYTVSQLARHLGASIGTGVFAHKTGIDPDNAKTRIKAKAISLHRSRSTSDYGNMMTVITQKIEAEQDYYPEWDGAVSTSHTLNTHSFPYIANCNGSLRLPYLDHFS